MCILNNCVVFRWLYVFRFGSFRSLVCTHECAHVWCYKTHTLSYSQAIINGYEKTELIFNYSPIQKQKMSKINVCYIV